jgi:hypothetical protein
MPIVEKAAGRVGIAKRLLGYSCKTFYQLQSIILYKRNSQYRASALALGTQTHYTFAPEMRIRQGKTVS